MAGIYIHIPFCRHKCNYCNFFSVASVKHKPAMVIAIVSELALQKAYLEGETVDTIYLGGGTPSLLEPAELNAILQAVRSHFPVSGDAEVTLEANPDDVDAAQLTAWKAAGVNRLSLGVQSFLDEDLLYMERLHTGKKALEAIEVIRSTGWNNYTVDLIYGVPTSCKASWKKNLETVAELGVPHISAYALTVESNTALAKKLAKGHLAEVKDFKAADDYGIMMDLLWQNGYEHYEVSNFALPGFQSRHNAAYWKGVKYLGVGPAAHSFNGESRQWNVSSITKYLEAIQAGRVPFESEALTLTDHYNEYVMTGLRTLWGCDLEKIRQDFGTAYAAHFKKAAGRHLQNGFLVQEGNVYRLTEEGYFLADGIAADLFHE